MNELAETHVTRPVGAVPTQLVARPIVTGTTSALVASRPHVQGPTDSLAIWSAVCGLTAMIPVVSQVLGLGFGIASLARIRRARRTGLILGGTGWAITGVISSGFTLICWIGLFVAMFIIGSSFANSADALSGILPAVP